MCSDASESVETELLVMEYCCNVSRVHTTTYVEDRSESRLQETLPDLAISCEAYNTLYHDIVADAENGSFDRLNDVFGEYIVSRLDSRGRPIDDLGELLSASELEFSYEDVSCQEVGSGSDKTTILDTVSYTENHGIVGVSCGGRFTQTIDVKLDACGEGVITRVFHVVTGCGDNAVMSEIGEQTIRIVPACPMRESMFDVAPRLGTVKDPICLPSELVEGELFDTIGALKVKDHLSGKLCNSISISHAVNRTVLTGY